MPEEFLFTKALWAAVLIGVLLPIVGRHLVLGRAVLLGLAIPQIAMAGIAFVFLGASRHWPWAESLHEESGKALVGSLLFGLPGLFLIATPWKRRTRISEAWLAVVYLTSVSATNLMLATDAVGETYLGDLFHGRLLFIGDGELKMLGITLAAGFIFLFAFRRRLLLTLTDPDYASVAGLAVGGWTVAATLVNGMVIGITVATAGPLVAFGFLVLPVLTAAAFAKSLRGNLWLSMLAGLVISLAGFWLSYHYDFPLGDSVVATGCVVLLLSRAVSLIPVFKLRKAIINSW
ncbi:MAG: metal ABC transporter permease [Luteolibacter sp.]|uniref:metal ABC transporter permease n=1 Tax=Luteolibacter sp. TaxID=1962973 RepID=UPI00326505F1